jgi:hypothetical protein
MVPVPGDPLTSPTRTCAMSDADAAIPSADLGRRARAAGQSDDRSRSCIACCRRRIALFVSRFS